MKLRIGLLINPLAGLGGSRALKGSDGAQVREIAAQADAEAVTRAEQRALKALAMLPADGVEILAWGGVMGERACREAGLSCRVVGAAKAGLSDAADTRAAATALGAEQIDLLLFAGGDGTARDIYDAVGERLPVLGIPAGVKMHSGVFAVSPEAAGELLRQLVQGGLVGLQLHEVRDIDEEAFRHDVVKSRFYGDMLVPGEGRFLQHTKVGGRESEELVAAEIADWVVEQMDPRTCYLVGPGSTTAAIMERLGLPNTLLGVDAVRDGQLLASDADEATLLQLLASHDGPAQIIVTAIGGQGHIFGRGNQQFSPAVIRAVGVGRICIVAGKGKIAALEGRPLLVDTNDPALDRDLCGYREVVTGYEDRILYRVATYDRQEESE
ncbi:ATP-NAD kinase [Mangrovimicrobium sediminis]|uniref:ATP-NAD kinase n=1 Tax=Mangrovimicrobium sediminis TaxID=2562682 RepID=A0A4Z0M6V6_9GAMM|nr:ATP-NAD kinase family protein [Haliea sp. SAOS-164]TGD75239.1 ATP-NAD kinase [Haliea sp. SAOS-164]